ncbi:MAG TPA: hypothetical protein VGR38_04720 [Candidatus Polarisedimenticolia bacterium]|nr:hypothetical protein [Candidatus Polarisedimenticolia bacterium]
MSTKDEPAGPITPGLYQLDGRTLVSVRLTRSAQDPSRFRAVALAVLRDNHRVTLSSTSTAAYGDDRESALEACMGRVKERLDKKGGTPSHRSSRRPEASL